MPFRHVSRLTLHIATYPKSDHRQSIFPLRFTSSGKIRKQPIQEGRSEVGPKAYPLRSERCESAAGGLFQHPILLPARGEDRLHLLRALIDGLIPCEAGLLREPSHSLNQLIHLRIQ